MNALIIFGEGIVVLPLPGSICSNLLDILFFMVAFKAFDVNKSHVISFTGILISNADLNVQLSSERSNMRLIWLPLFFSETFDKGSFASISCPSNQYVQNIFVKILEDVWIMMFEWRFDMAGLLSIGVLLLLPLIQRAIE
jgi:hypothetical protein